MKYTKFILCVLSLVLMLGMLAGCGSDSKKSDVKINLTIIQVLEDKTEEKHEITVTEGSTLREALYEAGLIEEDELASMFVSVINGHKADAINDGVTWMVADANGKQIMGTYDEIIPTDGQTIKLVYFVVPYFD